MSARTKPEPALRLAYLPPIMAYTFLFGDSPTRLGNGPMFYETREGAAQQAYAQGFRVLRDGTLELREGAPTRLDPPASFPRYLTIRCKTTNDRNGNPRRVWLLIGLAPEDEGEIVGIADEGYEGYPWRDLPSNEVTRGPEIGITPKEYHRLVREGRKLEGRR